jgi:hypothetical protein
MRLVMVMVLAALVALPLSASGQASEADTTPEPNLEEPAPSAEPAPEEPALQLKLDAAGVEVTPSPSRTEDGYTLEEMQVRVKRARIGLGVSGVGLAAGLVLTTVGGLVSLANTPLGGETESDAAWGAMVAGMTIMAIGAAGMITSGVVYGVRNRQLRKHKRELWGSPYTHYGTPRRAQWDLAQSRLVF